MSLFSFHGGHSGEYCRHAQDNLAVIVEQAIELGFCSFGMTEHAPIFDKADLYSDQMDQTPEEIQGEFQAYLAEACELRDKHAGVIDLFVGFETEVIPEGRYVVEMP